MNYLTISKLANYIINESIFLSEMVISIIRKLSPNGQRTNFQYVSYKSSNKGFFYKFRKCNVLLHDLIKAFKLVT